MNYFIQDIEALADEAKENEEARLYLIGLCESLEEAGSSADKEAKGSADLLISRSLHKLPSSDSFD